MLCKKTKMSLSTIIKKIASAEVIKSNPPVLIDIGASGKLNSIWATIAPFSICIAFDADKREFDYIEKSDTVFKKQFVFNKIVVESSDKAKQSFYLTQNPFCSSLLKPDAESLKQFHYSDSFAIKETVEIDVIELKDVLAKLNINSIDWFKTDTQGTDLRLYKSLNETIQNKMLVLEFEPGFMDAYLGEDKISDVMTYMEKKPFFLTNFTIKGALRMPKDAFERIYKSNLARKIADHTLKKAPGWSEMIYMNTLNDSHFTSREFMLAWLFATLQDHHDIAFVYAKRANEKFGGDFFVDLQKHSEQTLQKKIYSIGSLFKLINIFIGKYITKTF